jgi:hypothetical protein
MKWMPKRVGRPSRNDQANLLQLSLSAVSRAVAAHDERALAQMLSFGRQRIAVYALGDALWDWFKPVLSHALCPYIGNETVRLALIDHAIYPEMVGPALLAGLPHNPTFTSIGLPGGLTAGWRSRPQAWELYDPLSRTALFMSAGISHLEGWERAMPFARVLHELVTPTSEGLLHAAAITDGSTGLLLAGAGGSGKSTTTLFSIKHGFSSAGDDLVLVDPDDRGQVCVSAVYDSLKLVPATLADPADRDRPWLRLDADDPKQLTLLSGFASGTLRRTFPLHAIVLPRIAHAAKTTFRRARGSDAFLAIAPSTQKIFLRGAAELVDKVARVVRRLPVFWLDLGTEEKEVSDAIHALCRSLNHG